MFRPFLAIFKGVFNRENASLVSLITFLVSNFQGQIPENEGDILNRSTFILPTDSIES